MARASKMNRGYGGGLAAGAPAGTGFQSSFQSSMAPMAPPAPRAPMAPMAETAPTAPTAAQAQPAADISNMFNPLLLPAPGQQSFSQPPPAPFGPPPLPAPGQQSFSQPPPSPFGPAPLPFGGFRQEGGPVQPGLAYIVGEAGPELIVPQAPGMVLPNPTLTGRASAQDGAVRSGLLSTRSATPVGSGRGMTPERRLEIAARRGDQRANLTLFNAQQFGRNGRGTARALPPPMPMPMGRAPQAPAAARSMPNFPPRSPAQQPPPEPMAAPQFDITNMLPPMAPTDAMAPLPPSTLMGGSGVPGPPAIDFRPLPGNPGYGVPVINGEVQRQFLPMPPNAGAQPPPLSAAELGQARAAGMQPTQIDGRSFDAQGVPYLQPAAPAAEPKFQQDKDSGKMFYIEPNGQGGFRRKWVDEDGDGTVSPAEQAKAAAMQRTTASGVQVRISTQR